MLTAIATLLLHAVRRIRGFCRSGDALPPLLVLGFAHYASLTWAFVIGWIALVFALLLTTITAPTVSHGRLWLAAALIALLPGFGLAGVLLVPPLLALLFLRGDASNTTDAENPASRPGLVVRCLAAIVPAAACIASFIGIELKAPADSVSPIVFLTGLGDFLSTAVGAPGAPLSKERGIVLFVTALAVGLGLFFRARTAADRGGGGVCRLAIAHLAALFLSISVVAGRGSEGASAPRYSILAMLPLITTYLGAVALRRVLVESVVAVLIGGCILSGLSSAFRAGLEREHILSALRSKLEADAKAGMRLDEAAGRHLDALFPDAARSPMIGVYLETLRRRRFRSFGNLRVDGAPTLRSLPFLESPTEVNDIEKNRSGGGRSDRASGSDAPAFSERNSRTCHVASGTSTSFRIWIDAEIDRLRIDPSNRTCTFRLEKIDLVVPESEPHLPTEK